MVAKVIRQLLAKWKRNKKETNMKAKKPAVKKITAVKVKPVAVVAVGKIKKVAPKKKK